MISYFSLIIFGVGFVWVTNILTKLIMRKKKRVKERLIKRIFKKFMPKHSFFYSKDSLEHSFLKASEVLKCFVPSKNYKEALPWFIALGASESGKSSFLRSLKLERPIESDEFSENSLCNWNFFNTSVFLDIKGSLVRRNEPIPSCDEKNWNKLLAILKKTRPGKPIDGITLFISAKDLFGSFAKNKSELLQDAEYLYSKLWQLQRALYLKLPVYIVITGIDIIPGFEKFADSIPDACKQNIFGWSNPYGLDKYFNATWIDEMFDVLGNRIKELQCELFVENQCESNVDILSFFNRFVELKENLKLYLDRIFQSNSYAQGFFFRGVYFTGSQDSNLDEKHVWPTVDGEKISVVNELEQIFATELVSKKICVERNLCKVLLNEKFTYSGYLMFFKIALITFWLSAAAYLTRAHLTLIYVIPDINLQLETVVNILHAKKINRKFTNVQKKDHVKVILNSIDNITSAKLNSTLIPLYWVSRFEYRIYELLKSANINIVIHYIYEYLEKECIELSKFKVKNDVEDKSIQSPFDSRSFFNLQTFIFKLSSVEKLKTRLKAVDKEGSIQSFVEIVNEIFDYKLDALNEKQNLFLYASLQGRIFEVSLLNKYDKAIKQNGYKLFEVFTKEAFSFRHYESSFNKLLIMLIDLEKCNKEKITNYGFKNLQINIADLISLINNGKLDWINDKNFSKNHKFDVVLQEAKTLNIFNDDFIKQTNKKIDARFNLLKSQIQHIRMPGIGNMFYIAENGELKLTDEFTQLQGMLNILFSESFMQGFEDVVIRDIQYGHIMLWDTDILDEINKIFADYDEFIKKKLKTYPPKLQKVMFILATNSLNSAINYKLSKAQIFIIDSYSKDGILDLSDNIKLSFATVSNILTRFKKTNMQLFNKLKQIEVSRCLNVIEQSENLLRSESLYVIDGDKLELDHLTKQKLYFTIDINGFLEQERKRIESFSSDIMDPIIKMVSFIDDLDSSGVAYKVQRWVTVKKDLSLYNAHSNMSCLFKLEDFVKNNATLSVENLKQIVQEQNKLRINTDNFFEEKLIDIKRSIYMRINEFTKKIIDNNLIISMNFYNRNKLYFPFYLDGEIISLDAYQELVQILNNEIEDFKIVKQILPDLKSDNIMFIENLIQASSFIKFLLNPTAKFVITFMGSNDFSDMFEQNLQYLVGCKIASNFKEINYPETGTLEIKENAEIKFSIAPYSNVTFVQLPEYSIYSETFISYKFNNYINFVRFLFKHIEIVNNEMIFKISVPVQDSMGKKSQISIAMPINISINGLSATIPQIDKIKNIAKLNTKTEKKNAQIR